MRQMALLWQSNGRRAFGFDGPGEARIWRFHRRIGQYPSVNSSQSWDDWVDSEFSRIRDTGQWRELRPLRPLEGRGTRFVDASGASVVSFASNDYLGLSSHPAVEAACAEAARIWGCGTGSSRLIVGDRLIHHELEHLLARWKGAESALVFPSGYQANIAVLTAFGSSPDCRIVSDELNHASIIDGARLARAEIQVFRHKDLDHARSLVRTAPGRVIVVTDSVFSMDGDVAPVVELAHVCAETGALLVTDDAHAVLELPHPEIDLPWLRVGTLSKTLGSQGGFVAGPARFVDLLVNRARSFIFTTGLTPPAAASAMAALQIARSDEGAQLLSRLRSHIATLAGDHPSPIIPVVLGPEAEALRAAQQLLAEGLLVPAIRPPTVPTGTSRLRVSLSAVHAEEDVRRLATALAALGRGDTPPARPPG